MNRVTKSMALRMWGTTTPTVEQVEHWYGKFDERDAYDKRFNVYRYTHPIDQGWFNERRFVNRMHELNITMRVIDVLGDKYLAENGRMNDEAMVRFYGSFDNLVEWILWMSAYTTVF